MRRAIDDRLSLWQGIRVDCSAHDCLLRSHGRRHSTAAGVGRDKIDCKTRNLPSPCERACREEAAALWQTDDVWYRVQTTPARYGGRGPGARGQPDYACATTPPKDRAMAGRVTSQAAGGDRDLRTVMLIDRRIVLGNIVLTMASTACGQTPDFGYPNGVHAFGAKGDGSTDDGPAIQRAIDATAKAGGGIVTLEPGTYLLRYRGSDDGDGGSAITLRSGVTLQGSHRERCVLKLAGQQYGPGSYARIIASKGEISNAALRNFTIDGSRQEQGQFRDDFGGGAVVLGWKGRCVDVTVENLTVHDVVGQGIMLQGSIENVSRNLAIINNLVERSSFIGIQCSQFDGVKITDNRVNDCHDNGIDIYGDDTSGKSNVVTSYRATISRNTISGCSIGVFLETVADCTATQNVITNCRTAGVRVNRIHGEPRNLTIERNQIRATPIGVAIGGDTGGISIRDNDIRGFAVAGIEFSYNVSRVTATGNRFIPQAADTPIILGKPTVLGSTPEEQLAHIRVVDNRVSANSDKERRFVNRYRRVVDVDVSAFSTTK